MSCSKFKQAFFIIIGSLLYSAGISLFLDPNEIAPGGFIGLSVILSHTIGGETGTWYLLLNIPIIIIGLKVFGKKFILKSFFAIILNSVLTNILGGIGSITDNLLLASIAGSILVGSGLGLILKVGATTGGVDIIVRLIRIKYPGIKISTLFIIIDMIIVTISGIVFRDFNIAMFALITVGLNGRVMDYILYGSDEAKLIYIISDVPDKVLKRILNEMEIGATILSGQGAYSNKEKEILMCVVKKRNSILLQNIVKEEDEKAFMIITSANEIYGEGYKSFYME
ncbi:MAG: YitT family protein [Lachnospiraceae bacterium]